MNRNSLSDHVPAILFDGMLEGSSYKVLWISATQELVVTKDGTALADLYLSWQAEPKPMFEADFVDGQPGLIGSIDVGSRGEIVVDLETGRRVLRGKAPERDDPVKALASCECQTNDPSPEAGLLGLSCKKSQCELELPCKPPLIGDCSWQAPV